MSVTAIPGAPPEGQPVSNFRDAGGWSLSSGRMARGRLFRSAAPGTLSSAQSDALLQWGIGLIVDLRGETERTVAPTVLPPTFAARILSAPIEPRSTGAVQQALADGSADAARMRDLMVRSYRMYVSDSAGAFGAAIAAVVHADAPALIHCTAGKDRTGFLVAVIQRALGVGDVDVVADYLRTNRDWDRRSVAGRLPLDAEAVAPILDADEAYLAEAFAQIARLDGSVQDFIRRATDNRVTSRDLDRFIEAGDSP